MRTPEMLIVSVRVVRLTLGSAPGSLPERSWRITVEGVNHSRKPVRRPSDCLQRSRWRPGNRLDCWRTHGARGDGDGAAVATVTDLRHWRCSETCRPAWRGIVPRESD